MQSIYQNHASHQTKMQIFDQKMQVIDHKMQVFDQKKPIHWLKNAHVINRKMQIIY